MPHEPPEDHGAETHEFGESRFGIAGVVCFLLGIAAFPTLLCLGDWIVGADAMEDPDKMTDAITGYASTVIFLPILILLLGFGLSIMGFSEKGRSRLSVYIGLCLNGIVLFGCAAMCCVPAFLLALIGF